MISFADIVLRLCIALLLGALVGLERESSEHSAGLRTNALISLGCALFTIISAYGFTSLLGAAHIQLDPTRIASYVVAGIGFLGGGAIFRLQDKERVKGMTTAAAIWVVAAVGMACGVGLLWEAALVTLFVLVVLALLRYVEPLIIPRSRSLHVVEVEVAPAAGERVIGDIYELCARANVGMEKLTARKEEGREVVKVICNVQDRGTMARVLDELRALRGVYMVDADMEGIAKRDA